MKFLDQPIYRCHIYDGAFVLDTAIVIAVGVA